MEHLSMASLHGDGPMGEIWSPPFTAEPQDWGTLHRLLFSTTHPLKRTKPLHATISQHHRVLLKTIYFCHETLRAF